MRSESAIRIRNPHSDIRNELVRPEGLEPPAYRFEACRSIQLSYGRALRSPPILKRFSLRRSADLQVGRRSRPEGLHYTEMKKRSNALRFARTRWIAAAGRRSQPIAMLESGFAST